MPKAFNELVKKGARIRTKQLSHGRYVHIAYLNGKSAVGHVKKKKEKESWATKLKRNVKKELASQKKKKK